MNKRIKIYKSLLGLSAAIIFFEKVCLYPGRAESWGIGIKTGPSIPMAKRGLKIHSVSA
jgi:hypothetical protein